MDKSVVGICDLLSIKDRLSFEGKKGFVTGAGGGIGRTSAAALAELGGEVALLDIDIERATANSEEINKRFGNKTFAIQCDVTSRESIDNAMKIMLDRFGEINFVHSNAGVIAGDDDGDMELERWQWMVDVNLTGMMLVNQAAAWQMQDQGKGGAIVNTASMSAHVVNRMHGLEPRHMICYTSTKGGVLHMTKSFAMDFCRDGIRVNSISPGYMLSGIHDGVPEKMLDVIEQDIPMGRFGTMNEIGGIVAFLLSDLASYITGTDIRVDGGYCVW